jgi:Mannosyltransferase (PIG-V)
VTRRRPHRFQRGGKDEGGPQSAILGPAQWTGLRGVDVDDAGLRRWRESATLVVATRICLVLVAYAAAWMLASSTGPLREGLFDIWVKWDARHFLEVARYGYTDPSTDPHATAFFPLFPLLIRAFSAVGLPPAAAGMLVATLSTIVACSYLYRIAEEDIGRHSGRRAILYLLLFPTTVFLIAPYSEATFLAGAIGAFYYARRQRWAAAGIAAAVATASRAAGAFVLIGLVFEFLRLRPRAVRDIVRAVGIGALPLLAYGAYLWQVKGDPLYFFVDQREGWSRDFVSPIESLRNSLGLATSSTAPTNWVLTWRLELIAAVIGIALVLWALVVREWGYAAYMGTAMTALMTSTWYFSIPRMLLTFFPAMLLLARYTMRRSGRHEIVVALMAPVAALGVVVFTQGAWFY